MFKIKTTVDGERVVYELTYQNAVILEENVSCNAEKQPTLKSMLVDYNQITEQENMKHIKEVERIERTVLPNLNKQLDNNVEMLNKVKEELVFL